MICNCIWYFLGIIFVWRWYCGIESAPSWWQMEAWLFHGNVLLHFVPNWTSVWICHFGCILGWQEYQIISINLLFRHWRRRVRIFILPLDFYRKCCHWFASLRLLFLLLLWQFSPRFAVVWLGSYAKIYPPELNINRTLCIRRVQWANNSGQIHHSVNRCNSRTSWPVVSFVVVVVVVVALRIPRPIIWLVVEHRKQELICFHGEWET